MIERGFIPDVVTDQTSAHDPLNGYIPVGTRLEEAAKLRRRRSRRICKTIKRNYGKTCRSNA